MAVHTPAPWEFYRSVKGTFVVTAGGGKYRDFVASVYCHEKSHDGSKDFDALLPLYEANARLIAAAPDLLAALIQAEDALADYIPTIEKTGASLNYGHSVLRAARAAIARAEGTAP